MKNIFGSGILICLVIFLIGCSKSDSKSRASCLVEDFSSGEIVICFEGNSNYVKSKCFSSTNKNAPKVTFSETEGCPRDRGYFGYCIMDGGEYIPYSYIDPSLNISKKNKKMMKEMTKEDCLSFGGEWAN